jgi:hypothetical protein
MATEDHAIVVGIKRYPFLEDLEGPENDAKAMIEWLKDPSGGNVPENQIHPVTSSDFEDKPRPGTDDVYDAFAPVIKLAEERDPAPAGRRLYIFMAGHGFGPAMREASLLMANAQARAFGHNVSGGKIADHFGQAGYFEEVVLLMDCCREPNAAAQEGLLPWDKPEGNGGQETRWLYGFATGYSSTAREKPIDGQTRGLFTVAVLEALRSGAGTSSELRNLVKTRMIELMDPDDYQNPHFDPGDEELHFAPGESLPTLWVTLGQAPGPLDVTVERGGNAGRATERRLSPGESFEVALPAGLYEVCRNDGTEPAKVKLTVASEHVEI